MIVEDVPVGLRAPTVARGQNGQWRWKNAAATSFRDSVVAEGREGGQRRGRMTRFVEDGAPVASDRGPVASREDRQRAWTTRVPFVEGEAFRAWGQEDGLQR